MLNRNQNRTLNDYNMDKHYNQNVDPKKLEYLNCDLHEVQQEQNYVMLF